MATYAFQDIVASIDGPGGAFDLTGQGVADEGITTSFMEDKNTMAIGADGGGQHNLHAGRGGTITIRLLKTNPVNAQMNALYRYQTTSSANHGRNTITIRDIARGDNVSGRQCAFRKHPDTVYSKDGPAQEWSFDAIYLDILLGAGTPAIG